MPGELNFYYVLELPPEVDDVAAIEKRINEMQSRWSQMANQGSEADRRHGAAKLEMVPQIRDTLLNQPAVWGQHRERERRRRAEREKETLAKLDGLARVLQMRPGGCTDADVKQIAKQLGAGWDELKVRKELERRGVSFGGDAAPRPAADSLDPTLAKTLRDNLDFLVEYGGLKQPDLYELLGAGFGPSIGSQELRDEADQQEKALRRRGKTDPVNSARLALLGQCRTLLGEPAGKARYDNYRATRVMEPFKEHLRLGAGAAKVIVPRLFDEVVAQAAAQGIPAATARQFIEEFAFHAKFAVLPRDDRAAVPPQCGFCYSMATSADAEACHKCGKPLRMTCPNPACKTRVPTQEACCRKCGYATGNAPLFLTRLDEARQFLSDGDLQQARQRVEAVLRGWPGYSDAVELAKQIQEQAAKDALVERDLKALLAQRKGETVRERLASLRGASFAEEMQNQAARMIADAQLLVEEGQRLKTAGQTDAAIDRFEEALRACADCADARLALSGCLPEPPASLKATLANGVVALTWQASPSRGELRYRVVRKARSVPRRPDDGASIDTVSGTKLTDAEAPVGVPIYYAVYTERGGVASSAAAVDGPIFRVADVSGLRALGLDRCVKLTWKTPASACRVEVWSKPGKPPAGRGDGTVLPLVEEGEALDSGLANGKKMGYLVVAVFTGPDGQPRYGPGATIEATPVMPPKPVNRFQTMRAGDEVDATWTLPAGIYQVAVFVNTVEPACKVGDVHAADELALLGQRLPSLGPTHARGKVAPVAVLYLTPVSIAFGTAVVGYTVRLTTVKDVSGLTMRLGNGRLLCRWDWPAGITTARVVWRTDQFPTGPADPRAKGEDCIRFHYDQHGGFSLERPEGEKLFLVVYAALQTEEGWQYSSGTRREVPLLMCHRLSYRFAAVKSWFGSGNYELRITPEAEMTLPPLVLLVQSGRQPLDRDDGTRVLRIEAGTVCSPNEPVVRVVSTSVLPRNPRAGLFPENAEEDDWLDLQREHS
jgi:hypothetical protein